MDDKRIQSILQDALEEEIPASEINLWPGVKASLVAGKYISIQQGEKMNTIRQSRMPRFAYAIIMAMVMLVVVLLTPQGRTLAQSVILYFTQAENTSFPLQPSQIVDAESDTSAATAVPPAPLISVPEAETQLGFDVAELPFVPAGFEYLGVRVYGKAINIEYETRDKGGHLVIRQSQGGFYQSDWDKVPTDAVIPVKIGQSDGEFVQGTFVVYPGETSATWNPEAAILRLRWKMGGFSFEMAKFGNVAPIEYLDQAELIELAEHLVFNP